MAASDPPAAYLPVPREARAATVPTLRVAGQTDARNAATAIVRRVLDFKAVRLEVVGAAQGTVQFYWGFPPCPLNSMLAAANAFGVLHNGVQNHVSPVFLFHFQTHFFKLRQICTHLCKMCFPQTHFPFCEKCDA